MGPKSRYIRWSILGSQTVSIHPIGPRRGQLEFRLFPPAQGRCETTISGLAKWGMHLNNLFPSHQSYRRCDRVPTLSGRVHQLMIAVLSPHSAGCSIKKGFEYANTTDSCDCFDCVATELRGATDVQPHNKRYASIRCRPRGTHRRVRFEAMMKYKRKAEAARRAALAELAAYDQELGI